MYFFNMYKLVTHFPYNTLQSYQFNELKGQLKKSQRPGLGKYNNLLTQNFKH